MQISTISSGISSGLAGKGAPSEAGAGFGDMLKQNLDGFTALQASADQASQSVATGDLSKLHEAMISVQQASLALDFVVTVRNHMVEGVQELLRTQV